MRNILKTFGGMALVALVAGPAQAAKSLTETKSYDFSLASNGRVQLENIQGNITIQRWDEPRVVVEVTKVGEGRTDEAVREAMEVWRLEVQNSPSYVSLEVDAEKVRGLDSENWGRWRDREAEVAFHFVAKVPRDAALDLSTVNGSSIEISGDGTGRIDARNINGNVHFKGANRSLDLSAVNGDVQTELTAVDPADRIELQTVNGTLTLFAAETLNAEIRAQSLNGRLYSNLPLPKRTIESFMGFDYDAKLGTGGGIVKLETVQGNMHVVSPGSETKAGDLVVEVKSKDLQIPPVQFEWDEDMAQSIQEAADIAREVAQETAREARDAAREGAAAAREAAREGALEARRAMRDAKLAIKDAKRNWKDHEDSEPVRLSGVIAGDLNIRESNEAISVGQIEGNASLVTFAGDIEVEKIGGQGKLMTYGGSIQVGHAVGALEAETYGGDIEVNQADSSLVLKSKGGDIQVDGAKAGASIETLGGDIQAMGIQGALAAKTNGGEIEALLVAGPQQGEIALESLGGDVSLIIPKGMAANIHVEMVVRRRDAGETILQSNLSGLTRTIEDEGGDVRIVYTGVLNGGGTKITLKSHAGEVSLNEE